VAEDCGSRNGTWRNGERLEGAEPLADGDALRCGETVLLVRTDGRRPLTVAAGTTVSLPRA